MLDYQALDNLDEIDDRERQFLQDWVDYSHLESLPEVWPIAAEKFGDAVALHNPQVKPEAVISFMQLAALIQQFAAGLQYLGVKVGDRVALIADDSHRWLIADQGTMTAGAIDVVRSSQAEREELLYILAHSGSTALIVEDIKTFNKLKVGIQDLPIPLVVNLTDEAAPEAVNLTIVNFNQLLELGTQHQFIPVKQTRDQLATLIYTSGTTGKPKGVMLSHGNLLHQITTLRAVVQPQLGDIVLCILPTWHSYGRTGEYFLLSQGCILTYTSLRTFKTDLKKLQPHYMFSVPRIWEAIYEGAQKQFREQPANKQQLINFFLDISHKYIKAQRVATGSSLDNLHPTAINRFNAALQAAILLPLHKLGERLVYAKVRLATGGRIKQVISGGGALPRHIDDFFQIIGVTLLQGYGLTETSPVTHARRPWHNVRGSSGTPIPYTSAKIVDAETRHPLANGQRGLVLLKGPQIMQGYYQNPEATNQAIDAEGWFNSGDLGWLTPDNELVLTGRAKDTIVLTNGENIEPEPIEDACLRSPYIAQIIVLGQDQRSLGALIVPEVEALEKWAQSQNLNLLTDDHTPEPIGEKIGEKINLETKIIQELFRQELTREVQNRPGYRIDDRIGIFKLIPERFSLENGMMTQTLKIRRHVVVERYRDIIDRMFAK